MTEPVAYRVDGTLYDNIRDAEYAVREINHLRKELNIDNGLIPKLVYIEPLYEEEQLHPRVKMTKKQYDRLMWDKENTDLSTCLGYFIHSDGNNHFGLPSENLKGNLTQEDVARAWLNPEETIEIVPNMKWFVVANEPFFSGKYSAITRLDIDDINGIYGMYDYDKISSNAYQFDTEEQAELWTNPLTETVQLPVEGE